MVLCLAFITSTVNVLPLFQSPSQELECTTNWFHLEQDQLVLTFSSSPFFFFVCVCVQYHLAINRRKTLIDLID